MPRERRKFNRISGTRDPSLIVIATEGHNTERQYFEGVKRHCGENSSRLKFKVLKNRPPEHSAPNHVLQELDDYKKQYGLGSQDDLCMVIDRDRWSAMLPSIAAKCADKQYMLLLSNPCFELWLLLHFSDVNALSEHDKSRLHRNQNDYLKKTVRRAIGSYNPSDLNIDDFWPKTSDAIAHAIRLDINPHERWPNELGTRVYLLMQKVLASFAV
ncbi:MAG: hypothetical protein COA42_12505 [Alteromonadaceae bacterium]|nr:MAG: hypothetical protein COA42_12505 [Alteromonadaceae bacterium]